MLKSSVRCEVRCEVVIQDYNRSNQTETSGSFRTPALDNLSPPRRPFSPSTHRTLHSRRTTRASSHSSPASHPHTETPHVQSGENSRFRASPSLALNLLGTASSTGAEWQLTRGGGGVQRETLIIYLSICEHLPRWETDRRLNLIPALPLRTHPLLDVPGEPEPGSEEITPAGTHLEAPTSLGSSLTSTSPPLPVSGKNSASTIPHRVQAHPPSPIARMSLGMGDTKKLILDPFNCSLCSVST